MAARFSTQSGCESHWWHRFLLDFHLRIASGGGDNAFEFLAAKETLELTYTVKTTDSSGATTGELTTDTSTVTVTITGTNDSPDFTIISGGDSGAVTEDASTTASGNATAQVNTLTLSGTYETGDIVTATVNNVDVLYTVTANDADLSDIATNLAAAINSDPNLVDSITANASGDALSISSDTPGVPFTLTTSSTDGGSDNTQTSTTAPSTLNASGECSPTPDPSPTTTSISPIPPCYTLLRLSHGLRWRISLFCTGCRTPGHRQRLHHHRCTLTRTINAAGSGLNTSSWNHRNISRKQQLPLMQIYSTPGVANSEARQLGLLQLSQSG